MSFEYEMGSNDLFASVSFGGGGRRERNKSPRSSSAPSRSPRPKPRPSRPRKDKRDKGTSWSQDFAKCIRSDDTWHGSDTPATDSVIGCAAKTTISRW